LKKHHRTVCLGARRAVQNSKARGVKVWAQVQVRPPATTAMTRRVRGDLRGRMNQNARFLGNSSSASLGGSSHGRHHEARNMAWQKLQFEVAPPDWIPLRQRRAHRRALTRKSSERSQTVIFRSNQQLIADLAISTSNLDSQFQGTLPKVTCP